MFLLAIGCGREPTPGIADGDLGIADSDLGTETGTDTGETALGDSAAPTNCALRTGLRDDFAVYPLTEPPALAAGEKVVDATFGTVTLRITDADDGDMCTHGYSYWPTFNTDNTRLVYACDGADVLADFDPTLLTVTAKRPLFTTRPAGRSISWDDVSWSSEAAETMFAHDYRALYAYDVATGAFTAVHDLTANLPDGYWLAQMSADDAHDTFAWTVQDPNYVRLGWVVYRASTNSLSLSPMGIPVDEVQLDKSGRYLVVKTGQQGDGIVEVQVVDLETGTTTDIVDGDPGYAPGHSDNGDGVVLGHDNWNNRITSRPLASPADVKTVFSWQSDWTFDYHVSLRADDASWALVSTYAGTATEGLFHEEILQVATDGSGAVRRLGQHHTVYAGYYSSPRATISPDGCLVTFTSGWGAATSQDVFVLSLAG